MGALSLSTPELMQIHEVQADRVSAEPKSILFNEELFRSASSGSSRICRNNSAERVEASPPLHGHLIISSVNIHRSENDRYG